MSRPGQFRIQPATVDDTPLVLKFIKALAEYEGLEHEVVATEEGLRKAMFGPKPSAEAVIGYSGDEPIGFAVFFHTFSTFLGSSSLYLEDLFVLPEWRSKGMGRQLLSYLVRIALDRECQRLEWSVLDWNEPSIRFYRGLGAIPRDEWTIYRLSGEALERLGGETHSVQVNPVSGRPAIRMDTARTSMLRIRTIPASILLLHKGTLCAVSSLGLFFAGVLIFGELVASPDEASHALKHLSRGVPIVLLALAFHRLWRPRSPIIRVVRALFVLVPLMFGAGQLEHSIGAFAGELPHIVAGLVSSEVAIIGLGILLAIARLANARRFRVQQTSSEL